MSMILAMAGLGFSFNAGEHAERQIDALPAGWYVVQIVNSEVKPTKTPGGARLNLQFKILQGDFAGRVFFGGYNVQNQNPVAVQIAMEELAELSRAVGKPIWNDTQELHAIPFNLKVKVIPATAEYPEKNEPQQYKPISDMANVVYATKADIKKGPATPGSAFGGQQPQQGFTQPQQQPAQSSQPGWAAPQQTQQPAQQPVQQPVQQPQQQGNVNFTQAAQTQPWGQNANTQQPAQQQPVQQPQQTAQQPVQQEQPVQQQPQQEQPQQQPVQQQQPEQQQGGQPTWAQQQVQPGAEQPQQQVNTQQQQVQEPADDIAQAAQSQTPPWKKPAQE